MLIYILFFLLLSQGNEDKLISILKSEVEREYNALKENDPPLYYLAYRVEDSITENVSFSFGVKTSDSKEKNRRLAITTRVGSPQLDSTHELKGREFFDYENFSFSFQFLPFENDEKIIRKILWKQTQMQFAKSLERYQKVLANEKVKAEREDTSPDFSLGIPYKDMIEKDPPKFSKEKWVKILKKVTSTFKNYPDILKGNGNIEYNFVNKYFVDSNGTFLKHPFSRIRIFLQASTRTADGQDLFLYESYLAFSEKELPSEKQLIEKANEISEKLMKLRGAPEAEPYSGPAIFLPKATGVFFHEVLGHRLEGHRQKTEKEGQTFTKKVNQKILPDFISLIDDPTQAYFEKIPLAGHYIYDDEGTKAKKAILVENGILKNFLLSKLPIKGFLESNGHGRGQIGLKIVARQGNLIVQSSRGIPLIELKRKLIEMIKEKEKPYGLIFADISGGFTITQRSFMQAFKVIPLEVIRIYPDGREELVRGVDIVGTPISSLETIVETSNEYDVFNGFCGAESGAVPVSAVAPAILVENIEIEKKHKGMEKPPVLPSPFQGGSK